MVLLLTPCFSEVTLPRSLRNRFSGLSVCLRGKTAEAVRYVWACGLERGEKLSLVAVAAGDFVPDAIARHGERIRRGRCETRRNDGPLPSAILKEKFGVPAVLGIVSAVSLRGLLATLIFKREDTK